MLVEEEEKNLNLFPPLNQIDDIHDDAKVRRLING